MELFESFQNIVSQQIVQRLGWTLIHFLWQGTAVAVLLAVVLRLLKKSTANMRYLVTFMAMALIVFLPIVTLRMIGASVPAVDVEKAESAELIIVESPTVPAVEFVSTEIVEPTKNVESVLPRISLHRRFVEAIELSLPYIVVGWFVGVFGLSIWYLGGWCQLQKIRSRNLQVVSQPLQNKLGQFADTLGVKRMVQIAQSALVQVPTVIGHFKPVILLPAAALTGLTGEQIEVILAHELAHIKRCDYLVNILQTVIEILGFYHPAVWWISNKIKIERENCCDDLAVGVSNDRLCYAKALATMEEVRSKSLAVAASGGSLLERIRRLVGKDSTEKEKSSWLPSVIAILLIMVMLIPAAFALNAKTTELAENIEKTTQFKATLSDGVTIGQVIQRADSEARLLNHEYVGTEHILLALSSRNPGIVYEIFKAFSIGRDKVRDEVLRLIKKGTTPVTKEKLPSTARAKLAVKNAFQWAKALNSDTVDSHHLLLGLLQVEDGVGAQVLMNLGLNLEKAKEAMEDTENKQLRPWWRSGPKADDSGGKHDGAVDNVLNDSNLPKLNPSIHPTTGKVEMAWEVDSLGLSKQERSEFAVRIIEILQGRIDPKNKLSFAWQPKGEDKIEIFVVLDFGKEISPQELVARLRTEEMQKRVESAKKLSDLGKVLFIYANDNEEKYPDDINDLRPYGRDESIVDWALENVEYLGKGKDITIQPQAVIAYDKIMLDKGEGTNVLFNDYHVEFCKAKRLKELGIEFLPEQISKGTMFDRLLSKPVTVDIEKSPDGSRLTVQYAVIAVCKAVGVPFKWEKSAKYAEPERRRFIEPLHMNDISARKAISDILRPFDLSYAIDGDGLFLYHLDWKKRSELVEVEGSKADLQRKVDITASDFKIRTNNRGVNNLIVSIKNDGDIVIPEFKLRYYRGDVENNLDEAGNAHNGWHGAGPIEPDKTWNEQTRDFHLPDGKYEFSIVLDYDNTVSETDENNNEAAISVNIIDGKIANDTVYAKSLVEDFFKHNYRDISARKTIEWGEPVQDANGNISIRYKYEAAIWDKDKIITNQLFVFDKSGKLLSFDKLQDDIKVKEQEIESEQEGFRPQILTGGYILSVPADLPQLKELLPNDKSGNTKMITPKELDEFLAVIRTNPEARIISAPKILTNDGEAGEIRTENVEEFESVVLKLKNTVGSDRKTITLEFDFEYILSDSEDQKTTSNNVSTKATLLSEHTIAVAGGVDNNGQTILLLVNPKILERQISKTGAVHTENSPEQIEKFKRQIEEPVTVHIERSPENDRLSVQYAVIAVCKAAGVPYQWDKSTELTDTECRRYIEPVNLKDKVASQAIADMAGLVGLLYGVDVNGVYLYKPEKAKEAMEGTENKQLRPWWQSGSKVDDKEMNLSIALPANWSCYKNPDPGRYKFSWQLLPSKLKAWAMFIGAEEDSQANIPVRQIAVGDVAILKNSFNAYTVRPDSWSEYTISEIPAVAYIADYEDEGKAMVEYRSYLLDKSIVYWFVFRIEKELFEANKTQFDSIINSFELKNKFAEPVGN